MLTTVSDWVTCNGTGGNSTHDEWGTTVPQSSPICYKVTTPSPRYKGQQTQKTLRPALGFDLSKTAYLLGIPHLASTATNLPPSALLYLANLATRLCTNRPLNPTHPVPERRTPLHPPLNLVLMVTFRGSVALEKYGHRKGKLGRRSNLSKNPLNIHTKQVMGTLRRSLALHRKLSP